MSGIILQNPIGKNLLFLTGHAGGAAALAQQQIWAAQQAFPEPLANAQGRTALVIGSTSFGYGSATAIALRAAGFERIIGIGFEGPPQFWTDQETGEQTARRAPTGWYLTHALHEKGVVDTTYLADAFSDATRDRVIRDLVRAGQRIDLLVYSLAAPSRTYLGQRWSSVLKALGDPLTVVGLNYDMIKFDRVELKEETVPSATEIEVEHTRRVMGGDDLNLWVSALLYAGRLRESVVVTARSYIGSERLPELRRLYWDGSIGAAKRHIDGTTRCLDERLRREIGGMALTEVDPSVVTVASGQIPAIAKYLAAYLGVVDGGIGLYNDPLGIAVKLVRALYGKGEPWRNLLDSEGRLRLDDDELAEPLQEAILRVWSENDRPGEPTPTLLRGLDGYRNRYFQLFGFNVPGVDYSQPYEFDVPLTPEMGVHDLISKAT